MVEAARFVAPAARVEYLHVFESPYESFLVAHGFDARTILRHREESGQRARGRLAPQLDELSVDPEALHLEHGVPLLALPAVRTRALLVVNRSRSWLEHAIFGSVTRAVLKEGSSDVLVV
jgi:nucleotide-binding universal stress UspA family protein